MSKDYKYIADLVTEEQMKSNTFVNLDSEDIETIVSYAKGMDEEELRQLIKDLFYA